MIKSFRKLLHDKKGDMAYIETLIGIVVILLLVLVVLNIYSFMTLKENLNYIRDGLLDAAAAGGDVNEALDELSRLCSEAGVDETAVTVSFEGSEYGDGGIVQYGDLICIEIRCTSALTAGGVADIPVTVGVVGSCLSEYYEK